MAIEASGQQAGHDNELASVRSALAALVPASSEVSALHLVTLVATKLAGHGAHCAAVVNPPRGSLTVDKVRTRCRALLDALSPPEQRAVLDLLATEFLPAIPLTVQPNPSIPTEAAARPYPWSVSA